MSKFWIIDNMAGNITTKLNNTALPWFKTIEKKHFLIEERIKRSTIFIEKKHRVYHRDIFFNQKAKTNITGWPAISFSKFQYIPVYLEI